MDCFQYEKHAKYPQKTQIRALKLEIDKLSVIKSEAIAESEESRKCKL